MTARADVAVIGAGMAGLNAANIVARAGKRVVLFEASERCGGRILTTYGGALPVELGAEFVHGKPAPTLNLARQAGIPLIPLADRHFSKQGGRLLESGDIWQTFADVLKHVRPDEPDQSAREFLDRQRVDAPTRERFRQLVEGFEAAPLAEVSIKSLAADSSSMSEDDSQFRVQGGYGTLVEYLKKSAIAAGVELRLESPIAHIRRSDQGGVLLGTAREPAVLEAHACVVAVPLGVLQSTIDAGGIAFEPPLTPPAEALQRLAMGHACRVVLRFDAEFARDRVPDVPAFFHEPTLPFETFWLQTAPGETLWTAWAGGPKAYRLAQETPARREQLAWSALGNLLDLDPPVVERSLSSAHHHDFSNDPHSRGAYSFLRPGGSGAVDRFREPVLGVLFFAGEATDHRYPGTVAGALSSGERAAEQVRQALGA